MKRLPYNLSSMPAVFILVVSPFSFNTLASSADKIKLSSDLEQAVLACKGANNKDERLRCFDALFAQVSPSALEENTNIQKISIDTKTEESASQPEITAVGKRSVSTTLNEESAEARFGAERIQTERPIDEIDELSSIVATIENDAQGKRTFTLNNGQAWKESVTSRLLIKEGTEVIIQKGVLTVYYLKRKGSSRRVRVSRIK